MRKLSAATLSALGYIHNTAVPSRRGENASISREEEPIGLSPATWALATRALQKEPAPHLTRQEEALGYVIRLAVTAHKSTGRALLGASGAGGTPLMSFLAAGAVSDATVKRKVAAIQQAEELHEVARIMRSMLSVAVRNQSPASINWVAAAYDFFEWLDPEKRDQVRARWVRASIVYSAPPVGEPATGQE